MQVKVEPDVYKGIKTFTFVFTLKMSSVRLFLTQLSSNVEAPLYDWKLCFSEDSRKEKKERSLF